MRFAVGIPHTPWVPERVASLTRLLDVLQPIPEGSELKLFTDREPNHAWSEKLWKWAWWSGAEYLVQLQDDVLVDAQFWTDLEGMLEELPNEIIGLESVIPAPTSWYTTTDGLIGPAYVIPHSVLGDFLSWRHREIRANGLQVLNEDQLLGFFCFSTGRQVWHPQVTIVDHDIEIPSTYGNDHHSHRRPCKTTVRGAKVPATWKRDRVYHHGDFYGATGRLVRHWVKNFHLKDYYAASAVKPRIEEMK